MNSLALTRSPIHVLVIDDNAMDAAYATRLLSHSGTSAFACETVASIDEATARLAREPFDAIVLDLRINGSQGLNSLDAIRNVAPRLPLVVVTGFDGGDVAMGAVGGGADDVLVKDTLDAAGLEKAVLAAIVRRGAGHGPRRGQ